MSKSSLKKFKKNDYSYDDEEYAETPRNQIDKRKAKRVERALKTKDITALLEDEDDEGLVDTYDDDNSQNYEYFIKGLQK